MLESHSAPTTTGNAKHPMFIELAVGNRLLGQLSAASLHALLSSSTLIEVSAGHQLIRQGAPSDSAYLLVDGEVDVFIENSYGSVHLAHLAAGAVLGEIGVFSALPRNASVVACGSIRALRFLSEDILHAANDSPAFLSSIISSLGKHLMTYYNAIGFFANALAAIEQRNFDLGLLDDLMFPTAELMTFSQLFRRIAEQVMLRKAHVKEMNDAAAIQRAFLPDPLLFNAHDANLDIHAEIRPAKEVGGDLYDFFFIDQNKLVITIGDVVGKGVPAALFMAVTQSVIRLVLRHGGDLADKIKAANDLLVSYNKETMFVTLFCGVVDLAARTLTFCNCGHNAPFVVRKHDNHVERLKTSGIPLALYEGASYSTQLMQLQAGDCVVLFTDGISEALNAQNEQYGEERLEATVKGGLELPARELTTRIIGAATEFAGEAPQFDDMTCVSFTLEARCP
jgi:sigma-B regulation protein RsbU (phosphoserine phosphatase)